ncbi:MAG: cellulase family glycosylhydrolase, partial [Asticcacaulis sp.]|nr:cellulase family glycosylhydrolase [Asticcacaulis sp.]
PNWSQDVDVAAANPVKAANIAYTLHFYAGSHKQDLRDKAEKAMALGAPLFVTEWGSVNADGGGAVAVEETGKWQAFMRANCLSQANWAVSDKAESASLFRPGASPTGPWTDDDLTPSGKLVRDIVSHASMTCD